MRDLLGCGDPALTRCLFPYQQFSSGGPHCRCCNRYCASLSQFCDRFRKNRRPDRISRPRKQHRAYRHHARAHLRPWRDRLTTCTRRLPSIRVIPHSTCVPSRRGYLHCICTADRNTATDRLNGLGVFLDFHRLYHTIPHSSRTGFISVQQGFLPLS